MSRQPYSGYSESLKDEPNVDNAPPKSPPREQTRQGRSPMIEQRRAAERYILSETTSVASRTNPLMMCKPRRISASSSQVFNRELRDLFATTRATTDTMPGHTSPPERLSNGSIREVPVRKSEQETEDSESVEYEGRRIYPSRFGNPDELPQSVNECFPDSGAHLFQPLDGADSTHPLYGQKFSLYAASSFRKPHEGWSGDERQDILRSLWDHSQERKNFERRTGEIMTRFDIFECSEWAETRWQQHLEYKRTHYWATTLAPQGTVLRKKTSLPLKDMQGPPELGASIAEDVVHQSTSLNEATLEAMNQARQRDALPLPTKPNDVEYCSSSDEVYDEDEDEREQNQAYTDPYQTDSQRALVRGPPVTSSVSRGMSKTSTLQRLRERLSPRRRQERRQSEQEGSAGPTPPSPSMWLGKSKGRKTKDR